MRANKEQEKALESVIKCHGYQGFLDYLMAARSEKLEMLSTSRDVTFIHQLQGQAQALLDLINTFKAVAKK